MIDLFDFKTLVVDFDGTLVDINFNLSPGVKEAISKLISKGYIFSIATGRPYQGIVKKICQNLNLNAPQIVSGGAEIIDPQTNDLLWHEYIDPETAQSICALLSDENLHFTVEGGSKDDHTISAIVLEKINIKNLEDEEKKLAALYSDLHIIRGGMGGVPVLDITSGKATKHLAVLELSKILNIPAKLMIGVGDGYNDYPLLSACGFKVAMGNAPKELKSIADIILPDVVHDGLLTLINNL